MAPLLVFDFDNPQVAVTLARAFDIGINACFVRTNALSGKVAEDTFALKIGTGRVGCCGAIETRYFDQGIAARCIALLDDERGCARNLSGANEGLDP